jgi:hypothetical protein
MKKVTLIETEQQCDYLHFNGQIFMLFQTGEKKSCFLAFF